MFNHFFLMLQKIHQATRNGVPLTNPSPQPHLSPSEVTPFTKGLWASEVVELEKKRWYSHDGEEKSGTQAAYSLQSIYSYGRMEEWNLD